MAVTCRSRPALDVAVSRQCAWEAIQKLRAPLTHPRRCSSKRNSKDPAISSEPQVVQNFARDCHLSRGTRAKQEQWMVQDRTSRKVILKVEMLDAREQ